MSEFWESCLSSFQQELSPQQFNTWIKPLRLEGELKPKEGLQLVAPNRFILKWVKDRYIGRIESYANTFFDHPVSIRLSADEDIATDLELNTSKALPTSINNNTQNPEKMDQENLNDSNKKTLNTNTSDTYQKSRLMSSLHFDNLIVGKANELARAAASQVSHSPGGAYNPLFIYGGAGLGKTHLIHAIGNEISKIYPEKIIRYVHAEDYYTDVVRAYQRKSFDLLKRTYRALDVLLIDDIQFFNGKNRTQEEFFFVFNSLIESKKQIVISCDTYPKDVNGLDDRLVTRFDSGLTVQVDPPETEMRVAILKKKIESQNINLDDEVAFFIAKHLRSNVRELEGALKKVIAFSSFHDKPISMELAKEALKDIIGRTRNISIDNIQKTAADYYKLKVSEFFAKKRTRAIARPRQVAMWLCKEVTSSSYPEIGAAFGGRDHTTVIHAIKTIDSLRSKDNALNHDLHVLLQVLRH